MAVAAVRAERARVRARHLRRLPHEPMSVVFDLANGRDVVALRLGPKRIFIVNNPELVEQVLVRDIASFRRGGSSQAHRLAGESLVRREGAAHARHRHLVEPLFAHEAVAAYANLIPRLAEQLEETWSDGTVRNVDDDMTGHMLDVIGTALFGDDYRAHAATIRAAFDASRRVIYYELVPFSVVLWTLPLPATRRYATSRAELRSAIDRMGASRRTDADRADMLTQLVRAVDSNGDGLTERQVSDEAWGYLAQGAPAHVLTWCWWLLAAHPELEQRLHAELDGTLQGKVPGADDLASLPFTRAFVLESLRAYPPLWGIDRVALEDYRLGGETLPAGSMVFFSPFVTNRDERFWSDAHEFLPDRWLGDSAPSIDEHTYLSFGAGERRCLGRNFVLMYATLTLATLAQHWQLRPVSPQLRVEAFPFFRPRGGLMTRLTRRA